jgi:hypothetical protein
MQFPMPLPTWTEGSWLPASWKLPHR